MSKGLSNLQKKFCQQYVELAKNGTQAYLKTYKNCRKESTARTNASRLLTNANIQDYISELQKKVEEKSLLTVDKIIKELSIIAFTDRTKISQNKRNKIMQDNENGSKRIYYEDNIIFAETNELDNDTKKIIAGYKKTQSGFAVETYDKMKALELLGKYIGMFKDEPPQINNIINPYASLSKEDLKKLAGEVNDT